MSIFSRACKNKWCWLHPLCLTALDGVKAPCERAAKTKGAQPTRATNTASPKLPLIVESNHICIYCVNGDKKEFMCSGCVPEYSLFKGRQLRA
jgi:hypothetical protein